MADQKPDDLAGTDIIERLRAFDSDEHPLAHEAADELEIERLRTGGTMGDSQMRAMIDQACEDLGRHGLEPTDEAAQVVLNLIASASQLGRLVGFRNEPSAVEALKAALRPFAEHGDMLEGCNPTDQWCEAEKDGRVHWLAVEHFHTASRALAHSTEDRE